MSMRREQAKELRMYAGAIKYGHVICKDLSSILIQAADTIEALFAKLAATNGGGWIACEDRLPEDGVDVLVWYEYFRYGEYNRLFQTIGISFMYKGEWSGFVDGSSGWRQLSILAWQPLPEPYHK